MKFLIFKVVCHHLKLVLIPHYKLGGTYYKGTRKSHWKQQKGRKQSRVSNTAKGAWVLSSSKRTSHRGSNLFQNFFENNSGFQFQDYLFIYLFGLLEPLIQLWTQFFTFKNSQFPVLLKKTLGEFDYVQTRSSSAHLHIAQIWFKKIY
jgi:hypothetical protein